MQHDVTPELAHAYLRQLFAHKIRRFVRRNGLTVEDHEDLEHDLLVHILQRLHAFNPTRGTPQAFLNTLGTRFFANLGRGLQAQKRGKRRHTSLHKHVPRCDGLRERAVAAEQRHQDARRGRSSRSPEELAQLAQDLDAVLAKATPRERDLAQRLRTQSMAEIARELQVPRTTLYHALKCLRRRLEKADLRKYL